MLLVMKLVLLLLLLLLLLLHVLKLLHMLLLLHLLLLMLLLLLLLLLEVRSSLELVVTGRSVVPAQVHGISRCGHGLSHHLTSDDGRRGHWRSPESSTAAATPASA